MVQVCILSCELLIKYISFDVATSSYGTMILLERDLLIEELELYLDVYSFGDILFEVDPLELLTPDRVHVAQLVFACSLAPLRALLGEPQLIAPGESTFTNATWRDDDSAPRGFACWHPSLAPHDDPWPRIDLFLQPAVRSVSQDIIMFLVPHLGFLWDVDTIERCEALESCSSLGEAVRDTFAALPSCTRAVNTVVRVLREQAALEWCEMALRAALDERASLPPHEARGWI